MRLDEALPRWHHCERHQIAVSAPPPAVLNAAEQVTWREVPLFRALMNVRFPGSALPGDAPVLDWFVRTGFTVLDRTEDELLVGSLQPVTRGVPAVDLAGLEPAGFRAFDRPGYAKIAFNFRCTGKVLSTETRVLATDPRARRVFGAYWLAIRAGSGIIRHVWLRAIRRRASRG
ncbi:MAG: hypothetical protein ACRDMV_17220 [Streptosporangiales bacterium]